ncbi:MAG TPA: Crp/Fnr family transcriptional regulator [Lachnospiraceae bacterium]
MSIVRENTMLGKEFLKWDCFLQIKEDTKQRLGESTIIKTYGKGEIIFREREKVDFFYVLLDGNVTLSKMNRNHDRKVIFILGEGEMLNEVIVENSIATVSAQTLKKSRFLCIPRNVMLELLSKDYILTEWILKSMAKKTRRVYHQLSNTSNAMILERQIASRLWKLGRDFGKECNRGMEIDFDLSITLLADMVGAKRETVSRLVKKLCKENLIAIKRNRFIVSDLERLKDYHSKMENKEV